MRRGVDRGIERADTSRTTCRLWLLLALGVSVSVAGGPSWAADPVSLCTGFCTPVPAKELESTRGAGGDTQVGVILWDELRRQASPPPPPPSNAGDDNVSVRGPGSIVLAGAKSH